MSEVASYDAENCHNMNFPLDKKKKIVNETYQSKFVASCFVSRRFGFYLINAYLFNFLITAISLTNFSIKIERVQNRLSGTFTLILTSISFKWVTNRSLPPVSYMTSLDQYQIVSILYLCLQCVWHSIAASFFDSKLKENMDRYFLIGFSGLFLAYHVFFLVEFYVAYDEIRRLRKLEKEFKQVASGFAFDV